MKKLFFYFLFVLYAFSQNWEWQNPYPQNNNIYKLWTIDSLNIIMATDFGTILKTQNGGADWAMQYISNVNTFYDIGFMDSNLGFLLGINDSTSSIYKTINQGDKWQLVTNLDYELSSFIFVNSKIGWACGWDKNTGSGIVIKTTNSSESWYVQQSFKDQYLYDVFFVDSLHGWVAGFGKFLAKTIDGGNNWIQMNILEENVDQILEIYFIDSQIGWIVGSVNQGYGYIAKTYNGGEAWNTQLITNNYNDFSDVFFTNDSTGYVPGFFGRIFTTKNGGENWELRKVDDDLSLNSIHFSNQKYGIAAGELGIILKSNDAGEKWDRLDKGVREDLNKLSVIDSQTVWCIGKNTVLKTVNGGYDWFLQDFDSSLNIFNIQFLSESLGWIVGSNTNQNGILYFTADGGNNWEMTISSEYTSFLNVYFVSDQIGWLLGKNGTNRYFLKTVNGGESWNKQFTDSIYFTNNLYFFDSLNGWAPTYGSHSGFIRTIDGGNSWDHYEMDPNYPFVKLSFVSKIEGWAVGGFEVIDDNKGLGGEGVIYKTNDGGVTWEQQLFLKRHAFTDVKFISNQIGWAIGYGGIIYTTNNGGVSWQDKSVPTNNTLNSINTNNDKVWICGGDGSILTQLNEISYLKQIPQYEYPTFKLFQNYPNPFNNSTIFRFSVPEITHITLKIFNNAGQEIITIINKNLKSGFYEYQWNGKNKLNQYVSSGIYFYQIKSKIGVRTKKMILLR